VSKNKNRDFTPRETVSELDRYIIGQDAAKRAVAIALRNRWRRQQVEGDLKDEIAPKNIVMIGPTGCGKTEIARRLAKLAKAPFVKVEASKFTEVGYVGRDVESMIRDLVEVAIALVQEEEMERVQTKAKENAEARIVELVADERRPQVPQQPQAPQGPRGFGPFVLNQQAEKPPHPQNELDVIRAQLRNGDLEDEEVEVNVQDTGSPFMKVFGQGGMEELNLKDMLGQLPGFQGKTKQRRAKVKDVRRLIEDEEAKKLIDMDGVTRRAIERTEQSGIVFLDEIDKVASRQGASGGPDVSREGVQRDLLPLVEGSTVSTKHGQVKTDHILFIAAGAFHVAQVSDLIPELQGRFPIRVELEPLKQEDFVRILKEPRNALTKQYTALMATEKVELTFEDDAIEALAAYAATANERSENIGARRLHTVMEALLEELSFAAAEIGRQTVVVNAAYVKERLDPILGDAELSKFIL